MILNIESSTCLVLTSKIILNALDEFKGDLNQPFTLDQFLNKITDPNTVSTHTSPSKFKILFVLFFSGKDPEQ